MTKELARYFVTMIDRDLHFSFNGMGIPSDICEWLENQLMQEKFDKVEEFIKLRYAEQSKKTIKKKHKFRAMTCDEFCHKYRYCGECPMYDKKTDDCRTPYFRGGDPYRTRNGKYILIEVKE